MRRNDASAAGLSKREDGVSDGFLSAEIKCGRGLIEQQRTTERLGERGKRHREVHAFLFAAGQLGESAVREFAELQLRQPIRVADRVADDVAEVADAIIPCADGFLRAVGTGLGAGRRIDNARIISADI